jgi:putative hemolysin
VLLLVCLLLTAFFCSSEITFFFLQRVKVEHWISTGVKGAERVARMINRPDRLLSVILLGTNLVITAVAALATALVIRYLPDEQGVLVATIASTVTILIFGESIPKTIATQHTKRLSLTFARPIEFLSWIFTPFVAALSFIASGVSKLLGGTPAPMSLGTQEDIRNMISVGHKEGTVEESEAKLLNKVFDFGDRPVSDVMVPRPEVVSIEQGSKISDFYTLYEESPLSRFPVYQENMDNVVGILSIKDVIMAQAKGTIDNDTLIDNLVRQAYVTPETKRINELFAEMQEKNYHMCVVIDEFGGTAGIVSLSRLVEEIVGPVGDELAAAEKDYEIIDEHTFQVDGGMRIEEANEEMGLELPEGDYETVAGFLLSLLGHIPETNEQVRYKELKMEVTEMRGPKIETIQVIKESYVSHTD